MGNGWAAGNMTLRHSRAPTIEAGGCHAVPAGDVMLMVAVAFGRLSIDKTCQVAEELSVCCVHWAVKCGVITTVVSCAWLPAPSTHDSSSVMLHPNPEATASGPALNEIPVVALVAMDSVDGPRS